MGKKTANGAIDFARLFAVKERLAQVAPEQPAKAEETPKAANLETPANVVELPAAEAVDSTPSGIVENEEVLDAAAPEEWMIPALGTKPAVVESEKARSALDEPPATETPERVDIVPAPPPVTHVAVEQTAASATHDVREVETDSAIPEPTPVAPPAMAATPQREGEREGKEAYLRIGISRDLHGRMRVMAAMRGVPATALARELLETTVPVFEPAEPIARLAAKARNALTHAATTRKTEVRMQVPIEPELHRRLVQFAALRSQTLNACLFDILDAQAPRMTN